jgi:hypothetical protein
VRRIGEVLNFAEPQEKFSRLLKDMKMPHFLTVFVSIGVVYFLLATLTLGWNGDGNGVSPAYLPAGFAFVAISFLGRRFCAAIFAGAFALNISEFAAYGLNESDWVNLCLT